MSRSAATLGNVFDALAAEGMTFEDWAERIGDVEGLEVTQPWYVRAMVGFGAWLGSLLLVLAIAGMSLVTTGGGFAALGAIFVVVAVLVGRATDSDFLRQAAIATSLAGQGMLAGGFAEAGPFDEVDNFFLMLALLNGVLLVAFPDRVHRFLSVVFIVASVVVLVYLGEAQAVLPLVGPALAGGVVVLSGREWRFVSEDRYELVAPITSGLVMSAFGCLMLSTLYILPAAAEDFTFYPRPWISTLLLGALLLWVQRGMWTTMFGSSGAASSLGASFVTVLVVGAALPAPGIVLAILVAVLGLVHGKPVLAGSGVAFLAVFLGAYFYGIDLTMLVKSATLVATGAALLLARRALGSLAEHAEVASDA